VSARVGLSESLLELLKRRIVGRLLAKRQKVGCDKMFVMVVADPLSNFRKDSYLTWRFIVRGIMLTHFFSALLATLAIFDNSFGVLVFLYPWIGVPFLVYMCACYVIYAVKSFQLKSERNVVYSSKVKAVLLISAVAALPIYPILHSFFKYDTADLAVLVAFLAIQFVTYCLWIGSCKSSLLSKR